MYNVHGMKPFTNIEIRTRTVQPRSDEPAYSIVEIVSTEPPRPGNWARDLKFVIATIAPEYHQHAEQIAAAMREIGEPETEPAVDRVSLKDMKTATELGVALNKQNPTGRYARNANETAIAVRDHGKWVGLFAQLIGDAGWGLYPNERIISDSWVVLPKESDQCVFCRGNNRLHPYGELSPEFSSVLGADVKFQFACQSCNPITNP